MSFMIPYMICLPCWRFRIGFCHASGDFGQDFVFMIFVISDRTCCDFADFG